MDALLSESVYPSDKQAYARECLAASAILDWFSSLLIAPPDNKLLADFQTNAFTTFLEEFGDSIDASILTNSITRYFQSYSTMELQHLLTRQYIALFEGLSGPDTVPPYESFYKDEQCRLFQQPYAEMVNILNELDVAIAPTCKEPADHLALEVAALAESLRQQNSAFILELLSRLTNWLPFMSKMVHQKAKASFYKDLLELLALYLSSLNSLLQAENIVIH